jgi:hypothetical protein
VANLSCGGRCEILVVNPTTAAIGLAWEKCDIDGLAWVAADGQAVSGAEASVSVPPRGWVLGRRD